MPTSVLAPSTREPSSALLRLRPLQKALLQDEEAVSKTPATTRCRVELTATAFFCEFCDSEGADPPRFSPEPTCHVLVAIW
jgi:hypothetical protein